MPILAAQPPVPAVTQQTVDAVMTIAVAHCAPSTWERFAKSLAANRFPFRVP